MLLNSLDPYSSSCYCQDACGYPCSWSFRFPASTTSPPLSPFPQVRMFMNKKHSLSFHKHEVRIRGIVISWTLGKMVLEASKEVKPLSSHSRPLVDPVQDIPSNLRNPPIKPIRPPFLDLDAIEEKILQHLPPVLTRESLGFSPVMFLFYSVVPLLMCCMALRLCGPFGLALRRFKRASLKCVVYNAYMMEEGSISQTTPSSMLPPSLLRPLRRLVFSSNLSRPSPPLNVASHPARSVLRHAHSSPASPTMTRTSPSPSHYELACSRSAPRRRLSTTRTHRHRRLGPCRCRSKRRRWGVGLRRCRRGACNSTRSV